MNDEGIESPVNGIWQFQRLDEERTVTCQNRPLVVYRILPSSLPIIILSQQYLWLYLEAWNRVKEKTFK